MFHLILNLRELQQNTKTNHIYWDTTKVKKNKYIFHELKEEPIELDKSFKRRHRVFTKKINSAGKSGPRLWLACAVRTRMIQNEIYS